MKVAVLSGKGGTGKTFISVNLAACAPKATYLDCDVEEPNGHLFFKPENISTEDVKVLLPSADQDKCNGCRKCIEFCRFNALAYIKDRLKVFSEVCHSCGGCKIICPTGAIKEIDKTIGHIEIGKHNNVKVCTGILNVGEISGVPIIKELLSKSKSDKLVIIDCPPGSGCSVMESIQLADYCVLVAEPTIFGVHNFKMVYELTKILNKPFGVVINKSNGTKNHMEVLCAEQNIPVLCQIPYSDKLARINANGEIACNDERFKDIFDELLHKVQLEVR